jgi:peroxiredoxin Q/BCP
MTTVNAPSHALAAGDAAPDFALPDQSGQVVRLSDYKGKSAVVVFFYPKDHSPSCTREACAFRDSHQALAEAGAVVIGVSADNAGSHAKFAERLGLPYRIVTDKGGAVRKRYGATLLGLFPDRVTFVIDKDGIVRHRYSSMHSGKHVEEALQTLRRLAG